MILQFKNCYMLPQPRKPAVPLAFPFFHYIYVSRLSDPLPHYKQQKPVTHSTHAIRLSFLDRALPTFSPNLFFIVFSLRFLPAAIRAPFIPFQSDCLSCCPARQNRSVSHARFIIDNIWFHLLYYSILPLYLSSCNPSQMFCFFDMICAQALCLPFSVFLYRLRANKSSRFRMRFILSSSSFVAFSPYCSPLMLWAA